MKKSRRGAKKQGDFEAPCPVLACLAVVSLAAASFAAAFCCRISCVAACTNGQTSETPRFAAFPVLVALLWAFDALLMRLRRVFHCRPPVFYKNSSATLCPTAFSTAPIMPPLFLFAVRPVSLFWLCGFQAGQIPPVFCATNSQKMKKRLVSRETKAQSASNHIPCPCCQDSTCAYSKRERHCSPLARTSRAFCICACCSVKKPPLPVGGGGDVVRTDAGRTFLGGCGDVLTKCAR